MPWVIVGWIKRLEALRLLGSPDVIEVQCPEIPIKSANPTKSAVNRWLNPAYNLP